MIFKLVGLLRRRRFVFIGRGANHLHLVHIDNLVHGFQIVLDRPETVGETYIVADPDPITMASIVRVICRNLSADEPVLRVPTPWARLAANLAVRGRFLGRAIARELILSPMKVDVMTRDRCEITRTRDATNVPKRFDLVWTFCEQARDPVALIEKAIGLSEKFVLIVTQNRRNHGVIIHRLLHMLKRAPWDHGEPPTGEHARGRRGPAGLQKGTQMQLSFGICHS
jgi:hypothetical protein